MTKEVEKVEKSVTQETKQTVALDPAILAAINAAVSESVKTIVAALAPATPSVTQTVSTRFVPNVVPEQKVYKPKLKGIEVDAGQDLRHVPKSIIVDWFTKLESRWKEKFNTKQMHGQPVDVSWTRG